MSARGRPERCVAVFSSREPTGVLEKTVLAALDASGARSTIIDVLVNGNAGLARDLRARLDRGRLQRDDVRIRVWFIALADKAHAFNEYVHRLWPGGAVGYFIDGYARPDAHAFDAIADALDADAFPLGATGVPTAGRSARSLRTSMVGGGGIHGNLYALRGAVVDEIRATGCRLPLGLYRTDAMVGAWLAFGLDPARNDWDLRRVKVVTDANWDFDPLSLWRLRDLAAHMRRWRRQRQGQIENRAVRHFLAVRRLHPRLLPATMTELVTAWLAADRDGARRFFLRHPLTRLMLDAMRTQRDWSAASIPPRLVEAAA
jgi:hypothetical protein